MLHLSVTDVYPQGRLPYSNGLPPKDDFAPGTLNTTKSLYRAYGDWLVGRR